MAWTVETLNSIVDDVIDALPVDMRARLSRIANLIATAGLEAVHEPHIKHIKGALWEIRMKGKDGIARALYVTAQKKRKGSAGRYDSETCSNKFQLPPRHYYALRAACAVPAPLEPLRDSSFADDSTPLRCTLQVPQGEPARCLRLRRGMENVPVYPLSG